MFLKKHLAAAYGKTIWLPTIMSAEDLIGELSGLQVLQETELICNLYESYRHQLGEEAEPFESFAKWGQIILQDFNEIDRYLADAKNVYENLRDIKEIENWSLSQTDLTSQQEKYLRFMASLGHIYRHLKEKLLSRKQAWQGLAYRIAAEKIETEKYSETFEKILFCGFNAMNGAEKKIFGALHKKQKAEFLWDADPYYLEDETQEAGMFLRENKIIFADKNFLFTTEHFKDEKRIDIISVPKQSGQGQVVRQCLQQLNRRGISFDKVAVVLANEKLLWPVLQQMPPEVKQFNITMEYPLRFSPAFELLEQIIHIQHAFSRQTQSNKTIYHKDLSKLLRHTLFINFLDKEGFIGKGREVLRQMNKRNLAFLDKRLLQELFDDSWKIAEPFLSPASTDKLLGATRHLMQSLLKESAEHNTSAKITETPFLETILLGLCRIQDLQTQFSHFQEIGALRHLIVHVLGSAGVSFIGEPLAGLQVMGVLETRTLDFEHVILVNVNEGILPSGRNPNSFIPNDLKRVLGLALYSDKDAVYAYHFYRLLQRAKTITLVYDSETDVFGKGEKSRFITQLQLELKKFNPAININESVALGPGATGGATSLISMQKSAPVLLHISKKAESNEKYGALSPSSLISFKQCTLRFYYRYGALLKESEELEENPEAGTFGTILHLALENLYKPFLGITLQEQNLEPLSLEIDAITKAAMEEILGRSELSGKSILQLEVIRVYLRKLLGQDIRLAKTGMGPKLCFLEHELSSELIINGRKIFIKGKADRIDQLGGTMRIVDYKSSVKPADKLEFSGFGPLFDDPAYDKQLQLFMYGWLAWKNGLATASQLRPCIIPFKVFQEKPLHITAGKNQILVFNEDLLNSFEEHLVKFIAGIFDPTTPFEQTKDLERCEFCTYRAICNR